MARTFQPARPEHAAVRDDEPGSRGLAYAGAARVVIEPVAGSLPPRDGTTPNLYNL